MFESYAVNFNAAVPLKNKKVHFDSHVHAVLTQNYQLKK